MSEFANGSPTKEFFVEMLTRDIDLNDAILDLLDNCIDGVIRSTNSSNLAESSKNYESFSAEINISHASFSIKDNCGGIPRDTAENYAFRMGRTSLSNNSDPTIGIYGIGMKRAIFKIGQEAFVHTKNNNQKYSVIIEKGWANDNDNWNLPIYENSPDNLLDENGTEISITTLNETISVMWKNDEAIRSFVEILKKAIQESYSLIIEKGFTIKINGETVSAYPVELLITAENGKDGIRPFLFENTYEDVSVKMAIGFYAPMVSDDDIDKMNESKRSTHEAGITIVCNDRVVLYNDKSYLTGWGTAGVPNYHTQFIGIKGIVVFESNNPRSLPMTTTKRGVDHSSPVYIAVKDKICEGLKMFTNYTNQWKGRNEQERIYSQNTEKIHYDKLFSEQAQSRYGVSLRHENRGNTFRPSLPKPTNDTPFRIIRFSRSMDDIKYLIGYFYGDKEVEINSSQIGEKCFDKVLNEAKEEEQK